VRSTRRPDVSRSPAVRRGFRVPWVFTALLTGFILCYTTGSRAAILLPLAMLLGIAMAGLVVFRWSRTGVRIPLEVGILCIFVVWAVGSGLMLVTDTYLFKQGVQRMVEVILVAGCFASMAAMSRTPAIGFLAITGLGLILAGYGFLTGDFAGAGKFTQQGDRIVGIRAASLTSNANSLGVLCAWAFAGLAFLWRQANRLWQQGLLISLTLPLLAGAVYSGSRKAVVLAPLFLLAWVWFCYRRLLVRRASVFFGVGVAVVACVVAASYILPETLVGQRFTGDQTEKRVGLIREGLQMAAQHPLAGVGLFQLTALSRYATYAHNDYVEVAASTGLVGFFIYYFIFALVAWRLLRMRRRCQDPEVYYVTGICLAVLVTCAAAGFALVMFSSIWFWCFISGVVGFASVAERRVSQPLATFGQRRFPTIAIRRPKAVAALQMLRR
jgi:O-antigen ligase